MTGVSHAVIGFSTGLVVTTLSGVQETHVFVFAPFIGALASLLPDIDTEISTVSIFTKNRLRGYFSNKTFNRRQRSRFPEIFFYIALLIFETSLGMTLSLLNIALRNFSHHRGITHSLLSSLIVLFITYTLCLLFEVKTIYAIAAFVGYMSHLIADNL